MQFDYLILRKSSKTIFFQSIFYTWIINVNNCVLILLSILWYVIYAWYNMGKKPKCNKSYRIYECIFYFSNNYASQITCSFRKHPEYWIRPLQRSTHLIYFIRLSHTPKRHTRYSDFRLWNTISHALSRVYTILLWYVFKWSKRNIMYIVYDIYKKKKLWKLYRRGRARAQEFECLTIIIIVLNEPKSGTNVYRRTVAGHETLR